MALRDTPCFELRPATEADREFIWSLRVATMKRLVAKSYGWDEAVQRSYADESLAGQVVLVGGERAGVVMLKMWPGEVHLGWVAVCPERQGRGLGRGLVAWAQARARELGMPLTLQVLPGNPACELYRSMGFVETGRSARGDVRMRWSGG